MTENEFLIIVKAMRTFYPRENILPSKEATELWYEQLKDITYETASLALRKWNLENKWSPAISDLREYAAEVRLGKEPDWMDAWEKVMYAIRRWGTWDYEAAMGSLDELTKKALRGIGGFQRLCETENMSVERANFRDVFTTLAKRQRESERLPDNIRVLIEQTQNKMIEAR